MKACRNRTFATLVVAVAVLRGLCTAQAQGPNEFFPRNYAGTSGTGAQKGTIRPTRAPAAPRPRAATPAANNDEPAADPGAAPAPVVAVEGIGVMLSLADEKHFKEQFAKLRALALEHDLTVDEVVGIGAGEVPDGRATLAAIWILGGRYMHIADLSRVQRPITRSPTWLIRTSRGTVLLEGVEHPQRYLNSRGEFLDRDNVFSRTRKQPSAQPGRSAASSQRNIDELIRDMQEIDIGIAEAVVGKGR